MRPPSSSGPRLHREWVLGLISVFLLCSCSPRDYLTRRLATDLIAASDSFNTPQQFVLHTGVVSNKEYSAPEYLALLRHGWISANTAACPRDVTPSPCWDILLTASGVDTVHSASASDDGDPSTLTIPVAKRQLLGVTGISKQAGYAIVEFAWKWTPLNEIGAALFPGDVRYRSTVGFRQFDDGWRIMQSVARPVQTMDDALKNAEPAP